MNQNLTTEELEAQLGDQFRATRLRQNLTQAEVADRAGVALNALRALEAGQGARVATLVRVVRALGKREWLTMLHAEPGISPMQMLKSSTPRQRAGRTRNSQQPRSSSGGEKP